MPTFAWVALSMLVAGIGGALATWGSMWWMYRGLEPQPAEVLRSLTALGGVFAGIIGGFVSIGRGNERNHKDFPSGVAALGLGRGACPVINPGLLLSPFLLVFAPLQGLAALFGGFIMAATLWGLLWVAGIRNGKNLETTDTNGGKVEPSDAADSR